MEKNYLDQSIPVTSEIVCSNTHQDLHVRSSILTLPKIGATPSRKISIINNSSHDVKIQPKAVFLIQSVTPLERVEITENKLQQLKISIPTSQSEHISTHSNEVNHVAPYTPAHIPPDADHEVENIFE